jgi:hypothetical protein
MRTDFATGDDHLSDETTAKGQTATVCQVSFQIDMH